MADGLPQNLSTHKNALAHYENTKPFIKGKFKGERPLGANRRYGRLRISKDADNTVSVTHYDTVIMKYYSDGRIFFCGGAYDSISTAQTMQELLLETGVVHILRKHLKLYYVDRHDGLHYISDKGVTVNALGDEPIESTLETVWTPKKNILKAIREKYKPFTDYVNQVLSLTKEFKGDVSVETPTPEMWHVSTNSRTWTTYDKRNAQARDDFLCSVDNAIANKDNSAQLLMFYELTHYATRCAGDYHYVYGGNQSNWVCSKGQFNRWFDKVIKFEFANDLFERTEVTKRKAVRDKNAQYLVTIQTN